MVLNLRIYFSSTTLISTWIPVYCSRIFFKNCWRILYFLTLKITAIIFQAPLSWSYNFTSIIYHRIQERKRYFCWHQQLICWTDLTKFRHFSYIQNTTAVITIESVVSPVTFSLKMSSLKKNFWWSDSFNTSLFWYYKYCVKQKSHCKFLYAKKLLKIKGHENMFSRISCFLYVLPWF